MKKNIKTPTRRYNPDYKPVSIWEVAGYVAIALTVLGQVIIGSAYLVGQGAWLVANVLYLAKAAKQHSGKAEIVRNVVMSALTLGLMVYWVL